MPNAALYYPDWSVTDTRFLFEALLYWDRLACIVPFEGFEQPRALPRDDAEVARSLRNLHERFVSGIVPTGEQQRQVHERLQFFLEHEPPEWCRPENLRPEQRSVFSAYKFSPETMYALREHGWIAPPGKAHGPLQMQVIADAAANILLSELADVCGSESLPPVTSDPGSFRASCNTLLFELEAPTGLGAKERRHDEPDQGTELSFVLCSITRIGLRRREADAKNHKRLYELRLATSFDAQRRAFVEKVDDYVGALKAAPPGHRQLVADEWRTELERDRNALKRDLRSAGLRSLVDREGLVAVFLGGVEAATLGPVGAIGVTLAAARAVMQMRRLRREALQQHWSSWLFSVQRPRYARW